MLPDLPQTSTDSILTDDMQHINTELVEIEKKRSTFDTRILLIQGIWIFVMVFLYGAGFFGLTMIPTFIAIIIMRSDSGISKVKFQKIAKCLFLYTLVRSFGWITAFVKISLEQFGFIEGWGVSLRSFILLGINMVIELLTAYWTLQVLRLTNQYLFWINRKISRGVTEDDLRYNC